VPVAFRLLSPRAHALLARLPTDDPHARVPLVVEGDPEDAAAFRAWIVSRTGPDGHLLEETLSPVELEAALRSAPSAWPARLVEGGAVLRAAPPRPQPPEGAVD
jgi:hypothetical protein